MDFLLTALVPKNVHERIRFNVQTYVYLCCLSGALVTLQSAKPLEKHRPVLPGAEPFREGFKVDSFDAALGHAALKPLDQGVEVLPIHGP